MWGRPQSHSHTSFFCMSRSYPSASHRSQTTTAQTTAKSLGTESWSMGGKSCRQEGVFREGR